MIGGDHKLEDLRRAELLAGCSEDDLRMIASTADLLHLRAGDVLRARGGADRSFFLVLSGIAVLGTDAVLANGESDGAVGLLGGEPDNDELRMLSDGRVLVIGPREFSALIWAVPGFAKGVAQDLSQRLRRQHARNHGRTQDNVERTA